MRRASLLALLLACAASAASAQVAGTLTATYNVATGVPAAWRAPLTVGVRYTGHIAGPLSVQVGAMLREGNALPGSERLRFDGAGERHWGAGPRLALGEHLTLLGALTRVDRRYGQGTGAGYYVLAAAGLELHTRPVDVRLEHGPWTIKQWDADVRQTLLRVRSGPLSLTGARVVAWRDRRAAFVVGSATLRIIGPLAVTAGWDALPDEGHVLQGRTVLGFGLAAGR